MILELIGLGVLGHSMPEQPPDPKDILFPWLFIVPIVTLIYIYFLTR